MYKILQYKKWYLSVRKGSFFCRRDFVAAVFTAMGPSVSQGYELCLLKISLSQATAFHNLRTREKFSTQNKFLI